MIDILFINKFRENKFTDETEHQVKKQLSSGLMNSVKFISDALTNSGIMSVSEHCIDSNHIDKLLHKHKPKIVIIEGLWAMPTKFLELNRLHPYTKFIIRLHSDLPFIANEGIFSIWFFQYINVPNMYISVNSMRMYDSLLHFVPKGKLLFLPNYYPLDDYTTQPPILSFNDRDYINIGCFGAIRNLKNQLQQAFAAIQFAEQHGLYLNFHMNITRIENNSNAVEKNIRYLFNSNKKHNLIGHTWMDHGKFLGVLTNIDIGLQVSLTETFNIVAADCVNRNIPILVSNEIYWADDAFKVEPTNYNMLMDKLNYIWENKNDPTIYLKNKEKLREYCKEIIPTWEKELSKM